MSQPFAVDSDQLRALAAEWDDVITMIGTNTGPDAVAACPANVAGSHTAWACTKAPEHMADELAAAVARIREMVGEATSSAAGYDAVDEAQVNVYAGS